MARDPVQRVQNWNDKYNTERVKQNLDVMRPAMLSHFAEATVQLCTMETGVKKLLSASGVHTISFVGYLNYARQLYKLSRKQDISGEALSVESEVLLKMWQERGLDPVVLNTIRVEAFNVHGPTT
ncbi:MAG: hypothetical protein R6X13_09340 [bacterium]